ncbi:MAG TPA: hypothetical protein VFZ85_12490 [Jiangellaceae bacterium]
MKLTRLRLTASAGFVLVVILSACSDGGDPADGALPVPNSAEGETPDGAGSETPMPAGDDSADAQDDSTTEPEAPRANGRRIGGEMIGFTVELPDDWLNVPTDHDMIDAFVDQEDIPEDLALSMHRVVQDGLDEESLLAYGGTEGDVDIYLIASCEPDDGSFEGSETGSATVNGIPAARTSNRDSYQARVWLNYRFPSGDEVCWVRFPAPDESWFAQFDDIVATIDVL